MQGHGDLLLNIVDYAPKVSPGDIALHNHTALNTFPHDKVRASIFADFSKHGKRNLCSAWRIDRGTLDLNQAGRLIAAVSNDQRKADLAFEYLAGLRTEEC